MYKIGSMPHSIPIGYTGETNFRTIEIDMTAWMEKMPAGVPSIVHIRPGKSKADAYVAVTEFNPETNVLTWNITAADIGTLEGEGEMQIWLEELDEEDTDVISKRGKSVKVTTKVTEAANDPSPAVPSSQEAFLEQVTSLKTQTVTAKEDAEDAQAAAETAQAAAEQAATDAENVNLHPAYIDSTTKHWMVYDADNHQYTDTQIKAVGEDGQDGQDGQDATPDLICLPYEDLTFPVSKGTLCYHGSDLCKAKQDISTSEAWTAAHWDVTNIDTELRLQKNAIDGLKPTAQQSDIGKALILKTMDQTGKPTAFEYGEVGQVDPQDIAEAVDNWLEEHPEATTTVEDGAVSYDKLDNGLKGSVIINNTEQKEDHASITNPLKITFKGNGTAFRAASFADKTNILPKANNKTGTVKDVGYVADKHFAVLNGTASGTGRQAVTIVEKNLTEKIPAGTYKYYVMVDKGSSVISNSNNVKIYIKYDGATSVTNIIDAYPTDSDKSNTVTFTNDVIYIDWRVGVYGGNVYNNYKIYVALFPSDVIVTNTNHIIASDGEYEYTSEIGLLTNIDTMQHESVVRYIAATKQYVDALDIDVSQKLVYISPEMFGAVGDGITDDTLAVQACIDYAINRSTNKSKVVRGYGHYKTSSSIVIHGYMPDVYLNIINYSGTDAAVIIHSVYGKIVFGKIFALGTNAVGIRCSRASTTSLPCDGYESTYLECTYLNTYGNSLEILDGSGATSENLFYNVFRIHSINSSNGNCIYTDTTLNAETDIYGKYCSAPNGYLYYDASTKKYSTTHNSMRLHQFSIESHLKNGIYGNVALIECRTRELMDAHSTSNPDNGILFDFTGRVPFATKDDLGGDVALTSIKADNALTFDDVVDDAKDYLEDGGSAFTASTMLGIEGKNYAVLKNAVLSATSGMTGGSQKSVPPGDVIVYFNHVAFKPTEEWYYQVNDDLTIELTSENGYWYITPTVFDINASSVDIMLDWSYCCIAINHFKVIQHENKTARVYDKLGNLIFDGTSLGEGTYNFVCSKVPLTDFSITLDNEEVVTFADYKMTRVYTGENEKWTVTKETTIEL